MKLLVIILSLGIVASSSAQELVQGKTPTGASASSTNPVVVGGINGGNVTPLAVNADGTLAQPSSGSVAPTQSRVVVTTAGTPVALAATSTLVDSFEVHARKNVTTANTGAVYIGFSSSAGNNYRVLLPGENFPFGKIEGKKWDLHTVFVDAANSADAITVTTAN